MRVLGVITALGGSKSIPRKNIAMLCGRPLLAYTADAAHGARRLSRVVLSTDCPAIARVGGEWNLETLFRPPELARDDTPTLPVLKHVLGELARRGEKYDAVFTLQPTSPLRRSSDIDGAIELLEVTGADSVISFVDVGEMQPARMKYVDANGRVFDPPFAEMFEGQRRQDLPKTYLREGSVYLTRTRVLIEKNSLKGDDCRAWLVPPDRAINIDEPFDLWLAEKLLDRHASAA